MSQGGSGRAIGLLIARLCLACIFVYTGVVAIQHTGETSVRLAQMGYPVPELMSVLAAIAQLAGAASLILGLLTPIGCVALILFMLPTTWSFHMPAALAGNEGQIIQTFKNLALVGGLVALMFAGPGRISIDARFFGGRS